MTKEIIQHSWAIALLKRKTNPFRMQHEEHYVRQPDGIPDDEFEMFDSEFSYLLSRIGWEYKQVAIFKDEKGKAFLAWRCTPCDSAAQQSVHPTDGGLAQSDSESNPPAISG